MEEIIVYEKTTCSKCRVALQILNERGVPYRTIRYHDAPLSIRKLTSLIKKMGMKPTELMRTEDPEFRAHHLDLKKMTQKEAVRFMVKYPDLMQRPILERGTRAILGRPSEKITEFLEA